MEGQRKERRMVSDLPVVNRPPLGALPKLRFSSGYETGRSSARDPWKKFVGWTTQCGVDVELDQGLEEAGFGRMEIKHAQETEQAWELGMQLEIYPLVAGPTRTTMLGL